MCLLLLDWCRGCFTAYVVLFVSFLSWDAEWGGLTHCVGGEEGVMTYMPVGCDSHACGPICLQHDSHHLGISTKHMLEEL